MIFLPQLLYLLQNIPIFITKAFFNRLDSISIPFVWDYKTHRIGKAHLCKTKTCGGLALPNLIYYYWASNIRFIGYMLDGTAVLDCGLEMEQGDCLPFTIAAVILSPVPPSKSDYGNNPVIHNTIRIWKQVTKHSKLSKISCLLPIVANPSFVPSYLDGAFLEWRDQGIHNVGDLYLGGVFSSFQQLKRKYALQQQGFFRYLQVRSYVRLHLPGFQRAGPDKLDDCLKQFAVFQNIISCLYSTLQSLAPASSNTIKAG